MDKFINAINIVKEYPIVILLVVLLVVLLILQFKTKNLDSIKNRRTGQGQYGTASFMSGAEKNKVFKKVKYTPEEWRKEEWRKENKKNLPEGVIWGTEVRGLFKKELIALVDVQDRNGMMIGPAGVGKTGHFFIPNIEYASALGLSMVSTDTKGDLYRNIGKIQQKYYDYEIVVLDLRNPVESDKFNLMQLVNEYMDKSKSCENEEEKLIYSAKAEKYAKIVAKNIIESADFKGGGQNAYFYDSAEGLITASVLLLAEFGKDEERHIISVFKMIQEMCVFISDKKSKKGENKDENEDENESAVKEESVVSRFGKLIKLLPENHKAKWFAGAAVEADMKTALSVFATSLSRLTKFIDSEMEQMICFDSKFTAENFVKKPTSVFIVLPEEESTKHFMLSLFLNQIYRELLSIADENGGKLDKRVLFFEDEFGTIPAIKDVDMMFSASRSRGILSYPIIQSFAQLRDKYGKEKSEVILDNCQNMIFSGFAPNSKAPEELSKAMGTYTIQTGSVSDNKGGKRSMNYNMTSRALMTPDEIRRIKKGHYVVMMTGHNPLKTKLPLFFEWGIKLDKEQYKLEKRIRDISYISVNELEDRIVNKELKKSSEDKKQENIEEKTKEKAIQETKAENNQEEENVEIEDKRKNTSKFLNKKK